MGTDQEVASVVVRDQYFDKVIKQVAERAYKFKQALTISPTSSWKNFFYREGATPLAGLTGNAIKGIPRGADFPQAVVQWERIQAVIDKYGLENNIPWEDIISDSIDVKERTLFKIAEGVVKAVDDQIYTALTSDSGVTTLNIHSAYTNGGGWNQASGAVIDNLMYGKQIIAENNYDVSNLMLFINPRDHRSLVKYLTDKGAQFPTVSSDKAMNGVVGNLVGITIVVSNSVTVSQALLVVPKRCGTWKELVPLTTITKEDAGKNLLVRSWEYGVTEVTDPKCIVVFKGTNLTQ